MGGRSGLRNMGGLDDVFDAGVFLTFRLASMCFTTSSSWDPSRPAAMAAPTLLSRSLSSGPLFLVRRFLAGEVRVCGEKR